MPNDNLQELLRSLPQVDELIHHPRIDDVWDMVPRSVLINHARACIDEARRHILGGSSDKADLDKIAATLASRILALHDPSLRRAINASGIVIHTNLGRSPLAQEAIEAVVETASSYSTLEYDCATMTRGSRHAHYEHLVCSLTGAEAAIAVNNNAAAVMLVLSVFSEGREAIVSRGELVEIGGSFRIPDIMKLSHAAMVEVGTTNRTRISDYRNAVTDDTALFLKVHPSNYRMVGFTESVDTAEMRTLADEENARRAKKTTFDDIIVYEDLGSGALLELDFIDGCTEPTVAKSFNAGCDLVSFSGDKLLGGPQAGIIVGLKKHIDRLKKSPMARALRLDKMSLAALEATLRLYLEPTTAISRIPTLKMLSISIEEVEASAQRLLALLQDTIPPNYASFAVLPAITHAGGGALPLCDIDTFAVGLDFNQGNALSCARFLASRRDTPIIARIKHDRLLFDIRTVKNDEELREIAAAVYAYFVEGDS